MTNIARLLLDWKVFQERVHEEPEEVYVEYCVARDAEERIETVLELISSGRDDSEFIDNIERILRGIDG